jgi:hypothetical protein
VYVSILCSYCCPVLRDVTGSSYRSLFSIYFVGATRTVPAGSGVSLNCCVRLDTSSLTRTAKRL